MPSLSKFFDPFYDIDYDGSHSKKPGSRVEETFLETENGSVQPVLGPRIDDTLPFKGQGTIAIRSAASQFVQISARTELEDGPTLHLMVSATNSLLYFENASGKTSIPHEVKEDRGSNTLNPGVETTYWLSIDSNNGILRYGKYYTSKSLVLFEAQLKFKDPGGLLVWKDSKQYSWLESVKTVEAKADNSLILLQTLIKPLPVVIDLPPFVTTPDQVTLLSLELNSTTAPVNLPEACQELYGNVAGRELVLDDKYFPDFSKAIQRSCTTEGCWGYETLKRKAHEFGSDPKKTYLRITLGQNLGDSPGIPYVLEIWPSQHLSPIHDHGDACAVIRVLHGEIGCRWFNNLNKPIEIGKGVLEKGDITWIGDKQYQIHQLHNQSDDVCCTIQCYKYDEGDKVHYGAFNWVADDGSVKHFPPNSDMSFLEFYLKMMEEWGPGDGTNGAGGVLK